MGSFAGLPLPAAAVADVRGELDALVGEFNAHAQQFDGENVASVKAFNEFIRTRVAGHWDTQHMATHLLGDEAFERLSPDQQWQIQQRLETTFYRYAYEILDTYKQAPLLLVGDLDRGQEAQLQIKSTKGAYHTVTGSGREWSGLEWSGRERSGQEWPCREWSGLEWSGLEWSGRE
ncbi:hypothetical protein OAD22_12220 [Pseudomonadales bacterium]|nr:hypothetical protein [Pseudomonadales bacterium]